MTPRARKARDSAPAIVAVGPELERVRLATALNMDPAAPMPLDRVRRFAALYGVDLSQFDTPIARNALASPAASGSVASGSVASDLVPAPVALPAPVVARKTMPRKIGRTTPLTVLPAPPAVPAASAAATAPPIPATGLTTAARLDLATAGARFRWQQASAARAASAAANGGLASPELCAAAARAMDAYCLTFAPDKKPGQTRRKNA